MSAFTIRYLLAFTGVEDDGDVIIVILAGRRRRHDEEHEKDAARYRRITVNTRYRYHASLPATLIRHYGELRHHTRTLLVAT